MPRWWLCILIWLLLATVVSAAEITQRDWMEQLTDSLGWGYGLPDDPLVEDYVALLAGERSLFVEAEDGVRRSDRVAVKRLTNYGDYSGKGWISGRREPVDIHLDLLIPHNGRYRLSAATRLPGVKFVIAEQEFVASAEKNFTFQQLGHVNLTAGPQTLIVTLPSDAGIDFLELVAPPLPRIAPLGGWQPEQPLSAGDLAVTMLQALDLLQVVPATGKVDRVEAENVVTQDGIEISGDRHLGAPSGGRWVRSGHLATDWQLPLSVPQSGCYRLVVRGNGQKPVTVTSVGVLEKQLTFGSAMNSISLGRFCVPEGPISFEFALSPRSGIDSLELYQLDTRDKSLLSLLGLSGELQELKTETLNELLLLLSKLTY